MTLAKRYLETKQAEAYAAIGKSLVTDWEAEYETASRDTVDRMLAADPQRAELIRASMEHMQKVLKRELPTKYEDPLGYNIVLGLIEEVEQSATALKKAIPVRPLIGTLPLPTVNAVSISVGGEHLIMFQDQVFNFANLFAKAIALAVPFKADVDGRLEFSVDPDEVASHVSARSDAVLRFTQLLLAYLFAGQPGAAPPYILGGPNQSLSELLRQGMELFIMAHEYGHIIRGHLDETRSREGLSVSDDKEKLLWNWRQEIEADTTGLELTLNSLMKDGFDLALSFWSADLMLLAFETVEWALAVARRNDSGEGMVSNTHPPPALRRESLQSTLKRSVPDDVFSAAMQLIKNSEFIVEKLCSHSKEHIVDAIEGGVELAPMWRLPGDLVFD